MFAVGGRGEEENEPVPNAISKVGFDGGLKSVVLGGWSDREVVDGPTAKSKLGFVGTLKPFVAGERPASGRAAGLSTGWDITIAGGAWLNEYGLNG